MDIVRKTKDIIKSNSLARYFIEERKTRIYTGYLKKYSDEEFIKKLYSEKIGRDINLENPSAFTEKLQWLKLNYRDENIPSASDKYEAKKYIEKCGFPELLIPMVAVYDNADNIVIKDLPDSFIIKATHGSGWNFICKDKNSFDLNSKRKIINSWLKQNLYIYGREWNYKEQTPRIIVEPLMDSKPLVDYKFMCFNGKCRAMQVNHDEGNHHFVDFYDSEWNLIPDMCCGVSDNSGQPISKPELFDEMKSIAEKLAEPFPFVRVDLYNINGKIYFGEMTFFPGSGFWRITPEKYDYMFGEWLDISKLK